MSECLFCKIIKKHIPAQINYEDDEIIAFHDIHPKADVHLLLIPKIHITSMLDLEEHHQKLMGKMMLKANELAKIAKLDGYKIQINTGIKGGQEIFHLHIHLIGNK
jgi:histidine triad (HIT) family protein